MISLLAVILCHPVYSFPMQRQSAPTAFEFLLNLNSLPFKKISSFTLTAMIQ
jgi:hypothetical protein